MRPTEQDKELQEEVKQILRDGFDYYIGDRKDTSSDMKPLDTYCTEHLMQLITADRKRSALEARIDDVGRIIDRELGLDYGEETEKYLSVRIAGLKAQQEEV